MGERGRGEPGGRLSLRVNLAPIREQGQVLAEKIAARLLGLPDAVMRGAILAEILEELSVDVAAHVIVTIVRRGRRGGPPFDLALAGLESLLREERIAYDHLVDLYRVCKRDALGDVAALLLPGRRSRSSLGAEGPRMFGVRRELTLGERKSLARAAPREVLDRLLRDPEPQVIRLLLRNPRLVERDVVGLVARRPLGIEVAREVLASRWSVRYPVRRALVLNPTLADEVALRILGFLNRVHLREVATDPALPEIRRRVAWEMLRSDSNS